MTGSDAFFRRLVESSIDGFWAFDPSGRTIYASPRAAELLGRTVEEMCRLQYQEVLDGDGQAQFARHLEELRTVGPNPADVECCYRRKDGSRALLMVSESALRDEHGRLVGYVHRLTDDEARRELAQALSRSSRELDEAQSIGRVSSCEVDLATNEVRWSRQMYDMLDLDPTVVPSLEALLDSFLVEDQPVVAEAVRNAHEGSGEFRFDARARRRDGSVGWVRAIGRFGYAEDGTPTWMGGTVQDITDLKEAELQLVDAVDLNAMMRVIATAANQAATLTDALSVVRGHLVDHPDWERAVAFDVVGDEDGSLGLEPHPVAGGPLPTDLERRVAERVLAERRTCFEEDAEPRTPSVGGLLQLDGEPLVVVVITTSTPFRRHAMVASMLDQVAEQLVRVARRERVAADLAAARDQAMEASRLKSEFLTTMSHEIRTPMNGVIGLNELLLRTELDPGQQRLAQGVHVAGRALLELINDLLDFSKIEAGELRLEAVEFEPRPVFDQVVSLLGETARGKGIDLALTVADSVPHRLTGDPHRLRQIVANLASNAVKFTAHGHVRIEVDLMEERADGLVLRVEVTDSGIGIEGDLGRVFEPFRQADASTTRTFGGTGLGLAISRRLVDACGGEIGVESQPGVGSTFWFTARFAPAGSTSQGEGSARPATPPGRRSGHVLVVEDNEVNQLVALGWLQALGYTADVATNGEAAVARATSTAYDAILMDLQMPGSDGFTAAREIRRAECSTRVPIIAMTASVVEGERERCLAAGMDDFVTKPVDAERLEAVLATHVRRERGASHVDVTPTSPNCREVELVLDAARLTELDAMGEKAVALVDRSVRNFIARAPGALADMRAAIDAGDAVELRAQAHKLRGSALTLGANRVGQICLELELAGDEDTVDGAGHLLTRLDRAVAEAVDALAVQRFGRAAS